MPKVVAFEAHYFVVEGVPIIAVKSDAAPPCVKRDPIWTEDVFTDYRKNEVKALFTFPVAGIRDAFGDHGISWNAGHFNTHYTFADAMELYVAADEQNGELIAAYQLPGPCPGEHSTWWSKDGYREDAAAAINAYMAAKRESILKARDAEERGEEVFGPGGAPRGGDLTDAEITRRRAVLAAANQRQKAG